MSLKRRLAVTGLAIRLASLRYRPRAIDGARRDYRRFIVTSYRRCGSTMLTSALEKHSRAHCFGEVFNRRHAMFWTPGYDNDSRWLNAIRNQEPETFLPKFIFRGFAPHVDAVGFKLFPPHAQDSRFRDLIDRLLEDPRIYIVHLYRADKLAVFTSLVRARDSGVWATRARDRQAPPKIRLDPDDCASGLAQLEAQEQFFRDRLKGRTHLEVSYEELRDDRRAHYGRILDYLGLPYEEMSSHTVKQRTGELSDAIENHAELAERFKGTRYGRYFDV